MDAATPVVTMERKVNPDVALHIGADNKLIGEAAAHLIGTRLGGQGNVIELQGTAGGSATVDRHGVFCAMLAEHYRSVNLIADQVSNYTREPALKFMEDIVQRCGPGAIRIRVRAQRRDGVARGTRPGRHGWGADRVRALPAHALGRPWPRLTSPGAVRFSAR
jgi:hypothetical protein